MPAIGGRPEQIFVKAITSTLGRRSGRLVALCPAGKNNRAIMWMCRCDCGRFVIVRGSAINNASTQSCGCLRLERHREKVVTHGMYRSREYGIWKGMIQRCTNPLNGAWSKYGGRGITVCERWLHSFDNFYADMGSAPRGTSLDRENNDGNYSPHNCRWTDLSTQARNSRKIPSQCRSRFKGVYWNKGKWQSQIVVNGHNNHIGTFSTQEQAAAAYDKAAKEMRGDDAVTNVDLGRF